jgi:hypothetical protein
MGRLLVQCEGHTGLVGRVDEGHSGGDGVVDELDHVGQLAMQAGRRAGTHYSSALPTSFLWVFAAARNRPHVKCGY